MENQECGGGECCGPVGWGEPVGLGARPLLTPVQAGGLQAVFKVLANDTRLRLLHALVRSGELRVTELAARLGMKPAAVSNQLQRLSDLGILASRRDGTSVFYRIVNRCVAPLLELALCLTETERGQRPTQASES
jgi:DNA-binding transcriptional ArsR family regulator